MTELTTQQNWDNSSEYKKTAQHLELKVIFEFLFYQELEVLYQSLC